VNQKAAANLSVTSTTNGSWSGWYPNTTRYNLDSGDKVSLSVESTSPQTNGNLSADAMAFVSLSDIYVDDSWSGKKSGEDLGEGKILGLTHFNYSGRNKYGFKWGNSKRSEGNL